MLLVPLADQDICTFPCTHEHAKLKVKVKTKSLKNMHFYLTGKYLYI